jgi:hypothetical protein
MPVAIKGTGGGSVTLTASTASADTTLTLPNTTGTVVLSTATAVGQVPFSTDGSTFTATQKIVQGTAQASTSGTSIDFTSIPSWVKRVTVMFTGVSTNGTSPTVIQIGAGSVVTTGYNGAVGAITTAGAVGAATATSYIYVSNNPTAATALYGSMILSLLGSNTWAFQGISFLRADTVAYSAGTLALGGALDRVRITMANGTDTFDAGSINIMYE